MSQSRDLTTGPVSGHFRALAVPMAIGMVFTTLYNVVDTFYAGMISTDAQAGLAISFQVFFVMLAFGFGLNAALNALVGKALGEKRAGQAKRIACQGITYSVLASVVLSIIGFYATPYLLAIVSEPGAYRAAGQSYLQVLLFAAPSFLVAFSANGILGAQGDMTSMQRAQIAAFFCNLVLNPLLIFGVPGVVGGIGFNGIAVSTAISQTGVMVFILHRVFCSDVMAHKQDAVFRPRGKWLNQITQQALPTCFTMIVMMMAGFVMQYFLKEFGAAAVAAYGVGLRVEQLILLPGFGLTGALLPIVAQNFGAGQFDRVREALWFCCKTGVLLMLCGSAVLWLAAPYAMAVFTDDPEVIRIGAQYLRVDGFILPVYIVLFAINSFLQALQKPIYTLWVGIYRQGVAVFAFVWLFVRLFDMGTLGVWFGLALAVTTGLVLSLVLSARVARSEIGGWRS
ncbi:MATE family efflux transporter [Amylibacter cionae]|uniref:MATE family efflux transporter n=2 Tax=Neptunicoccus cionae TaxID=2035344 RepID=A0A916QUY8_9RHOB|nr:MATE family efflux transporter [Amylibacter cionae]